jgi:hypothetical protein
MPACTMATCTDPTVGSPNPQRGNLPPSILDRENNRLAKRHGRRRRERLRFTNQREPRFVERRAAGASDNSAADEASSAIKAEDNQHIAFLAARPRVSRISLLALELPANLLLPRIESGDLLRREPWRRRCSESRTAAAQERQQQQAPAECSGTPPCRHCNPHPCPLLTRPVVRPAIASDVAAAQRLRPDP